MSVTMIFLGVVLFCIISFVLMYNSLVNKKNQTENSFAGVDAVLKKRYDLIPNLIATVRQYMQHEKGVLTEITEMRAKAMSGGLSNDEKIALNNKISKSLSGIMVAVENYPDLKASANFDQLQRTMTEIEEQLSAARRAFNAAIKDYNNAIEMIPTNIISALIGYKKKAFFETPATERQNINANDLFNQ